MQILDGARLTSSTSGIGNAGNVNIINANTVIMRGGGDNQTTPGAIDDFSGGISILVQGQGEGGSIDINTRTLEASDGIVLATLTRGEGNAGNVTISATETVSFSDSFILSEVQPQGIGNGGNIEVTASSLALSDGAQFTTSTAGRGRAGDIQITVAHKLSLAGDETGLFATTEDVLLGGIRVQEEDDAGQLIDSAFDTPRSSGSFVSSIAGQLSDENDVDLYRIYLEGDQSFSASTVETTLIDTQLFLFDESGIGIYGNNDAVNNDSEDSNDNIALRQSKLEADILLTPSQSGTYYLGISSSSAVPASGEDNDRFENLIFETAVNGDPGFEVVYPDGLFENGDILLPEGEAADFPLSRWNPEFVSFDPISEGEYVIRFTGTEQVPGISAPGQAGGNIRLESNLLSVNDGAEISAITSGEGAAGNLEVNTRILNVTNGGQLLTTTTGNGRAGDIEIMPLDSQPSSLTANIQNGRISTSTSGNGVGGNLNITAPNAATLLQGNGELLAETTGPQRAGNLKITTDALTIRDRTLVSVSARGDESAPATSIGTAGNLNINARTVRLDNEAQVAAETVSGQGNIDFQIDDLLLLRRDSVISTNAQGNANGGNININLPEGFVIAVPDENSDIIANATDRNGGAITLRANRILGFTSRDGFTTAELRGNTTSDLSASSEGGGIDGSITLDNLAFDPAQGLNELPLNLSDASNDITAGCRANASDTDQSEFVVTGRGGLPNSPSDPLSPSLDNAPWVTSSDSEISTATSNITTSQPSAETLLEAQGWVTRVDGQIFFITEPETEVSPQASGLPLVNLCAATMDP